MNNGGDLMIPKVSSPWLSTDARISLGQTRPGCVMSHLLPLQQPNINTSPGIHARQSKSLPCIVTFNETPVAAYGKSFGSYHSQHGVIGTGFSALLTIRAIVVTIIDGLSI
jgi:hypothetical protein